LRNPGLKKFLKKNAEGDTLAVLDSKLGSIIKEKLDIPCIYRCAKAKATLIDQDLHFCTSPLVGSARLQLSLHPGVLIMFAISAVGPPQMMLCST